MMLRSSIIIGLSFISSISYAAAFYPTEECGGPTLPCTHTGWALAIETNYTQVTHNGRFDNQFLQPAWTPGFRIDFDYYFAEGKDLNFNWTHFEKRTHVGTEVRNDNDFHAVNFEFGQTNRTTGRLTSRFHVGIQYVRVADRLITWQSSAPPGITQLDTDSRFNGLGPRVGVDKHYQMTEQWGLVARAAAALLVGDLSWRQTTVQNNNEQLNERKQVTLVPSVEARLGVQYGYVINPENQVSLEGGYQLASYLQSVRNSLGQQTNFAYHGPYLTLRWAGDI